MQKGLRTQLAVWTLESFCLYCTPRAAGTESTSHCVVLCDKAIVSTLLLEHLAGNVLICRSFGNSLSLSLSPSTPLLSPFSLSHSFLVRLRRRPFSSVLRVNVELWDAFSFSLVSRSIKNFS